MLHTILLQYKLGSDLEEILILRSLERFQYPLCCLVVYMDCVYVYGCNASMAIVSKHI